MRSRVWRTRGRPKGNHHPRSDAKTLEYLIKLSAKHQIDPNELFNAFVHTWKSGRAQCRNLTVQSRTRKNNKCVFLITEGHSVVAQFPMQEELLREPNPLDQFKIPPRTSRISTTKDRKALATGHVRIEDLRAGMKGISLVARVIRISRPKLVLTRLNEYALLAKATLSDRNSTIKVPLWNQRIRSVSVNDKVQVDNAKVIVFRGEQQLRIGRNSSLRVVETNSACATKGPIESIAK